MKTWCTLHFILIKTECKRNIFYFVSYSPDNAKAYINLVFRGDIHREIIHTIIEKHTRRVVGLDFDVLMIDDFIVDIESHLSVSTSTAKPLPDGKL